MAFADDVKEYCRTDEEITPYIDAAEIYLTNAGISVCESNPLYGLAVKMLVSTWYDNRTSEPLSKSAPQPCGLAGIVQQLQLEVSDG